MSTEQHMCPEERARKRNLIDHVAGLAINKPWLWAQAYRGQEFEYVRHSAWMCLPAQGKWLVPLLWIQ